MKVRKRTRQPDPTLVRSRVLSFEGNNRRATEVIVAQVGKVRKQRTLSFRRYANP